METGECTRVPAAAATTGNGGMTIKYGSSVLSMHPKLPLQPCSLPNASHFISAQSLVSLSWLMESSWWSHNVQHPARIKYNEYTMLGIMVMALSRSWLGVMTRFCKKASASNPSFLLGDTELRVMLLLLGVLRPGCFGGAPRSMSLLLSEDCSSTNTRGLSSMWWDVAILWVEIANFLGRLLPQLLQKLFPF